MRKNKLSTPLAILGSIVAVSQVQAEDLFAPTGTYEPLVFEQQPPQNHANQQVAQYNQAQNQQHVPTYQQQNLNANVPPVASIGTLPVPTYVSENARAAYNNAINRAIGMTPEMIRETKQKFAAKKAALDENLNAYSAKTKSRTLSVPLGIAGKKHTIRTGVGYSTVISVIDSTGQPWDIANVTTGNGSAFDVMRLDGPEGSLFSIQARQNNIKSNIAFTLHEGQSSKRKIPIVFDIVSGQKEVDDKLVLRVEGVGPNGDVSRAKLSLGVDSKYSSWLDGEVPARAIALKSNNRFVKAWKDEDGSFVLISKYHIYSPHSTVMLSSSDGEAHLFKLASPASVLWGKDKTTGKDEKILLSGF